MTSVQNGTLPNSEKVDHMPQSAASDQGLYCLLKLRNILLKIQGVKQPETLNGAVHVKLSSGCVSTQSYQSIGCAFYGCQMLLNGYMCHIWVKWYLCKVSAC